MRSSRGSLVIGFIEWSCAPTSASSTWLCCSCSSSGSRRRGAAVGCWAARPSACRLAPGASSVASLAVLAPLRDGDVLRGSGFLAVYLSGLSMIGVAARPPDRLRVHAACLGRAAAISRAACSLPDPLATTPCMHARGTLVLVFVARPRRLRRDGACAAVSSDRLVPLGGCAALPIVLALFPVIEEVPKHETFLHTRSSVLVRRSARPTFNVWRRGWELTTPSGAGRAAVESVDS